MEQFSYLSLDQLKIGGKHPCFIVAEIGQNHQGEIGNAKELIRQAKKAGVDCVKFQRSNLPHRFTKMTLESPYIGENSFGSTYGKHRAHLEFSEPDFKELQRYAEKEIGIHFSASPMDIPSVDALISMNVPFIKIGSGDTNNFPLIEHIAKHNIPVILSTGMQDFATVKQAHDIIRQYHSELVLLHCVSAYPTPPSAVNLRVLDLYRQEFPNTVIGYSGHEKGINIPIAAVARGAKVIEKHFTLDKTQKGTDHQCSLNPIEMEDLVNGIREVELALGVPIKKILPCEEPCHLKLGKSLVTAKRILAGTKLQLSDFNVKVSRPMGIAPQSLYSLVGARTLEDIDEDEPIELCPDGTIIRAISK